MREALAAYLSAAHGPFQVVTELTRRHGEATVLELEDAAGSRWFAKQHSRPATWQRERRAYQRWTPRLGDRAPKLHGADEATRTLVLSKLPGERATNTPDAHHQAGRLLRTFHASAPARPYPEYAAETHRRLDTLMDDGAGLFDQEEVDFLRGEIASLHELPTPLSVPCHLDYAPRNWLVDEQGTLRAIDFAGARRQVWVRDLLRMQFSNWYEQPALRDAFFDGYGRRPTDDETHFLLRTGALTAASRIVWGSEHDLPTVVEDGRLILGRLRAGSAPG